MKRIGYIFNSERIIGGGELSFIDLVDEIRALGVKPVVFVPGPGAVRDRIALLGIEVHETPFPPVRLRSLAGFARRHARLAGLFKDLGLDLVHANGARCMLYAGPAARRAGIPCVWHVRVLERDRILDRIRARCANVVIANSNAAAKTLRPFLPKSTGCEVVYNGIKLDQLSAAPVADLKTEFGIHGGPVILSVGRFSRGKAIDDLIRACRVLKNENMPLSCLLIGRALPEEADCEADLKALAGRLDLTNVIFPGWREDVPSIMKASSVFVLPSRVEAFGRGIPEAWACGLPIVATKEGGPAELITHEVNGLLVKVGDVDAIAWAIISVLRDRALAKRLAAAGREKAQAFSLLNHARRISGIYESILQ